MKELIARLKELEKLATHGEWKYNWPSPDSYIYVDKEGYDANKYIVLRYDMVVGHDVEFIAETRNALPELLSYIEALEYLMKVSKAYIDCYGGNSRDIFDEGHFKQSMDAQMREALNKVKEMQDDCIRSPIKRAV